MPHVAPLRDRRGRRRGADPVHAGVLGVPGLRPRSDRPLVTRARDAAGRRRARHVPGRLQRSQPGRSSTRCALADALADDTTTSPRRCADTRTRAWGPTAEIVHSNRKGGPEGVIDAVEALAPDGFDDVEAVLPYAEREAIVRGYAQKAGFAVPATDAGNHDKENRHDPANQARRDGGGRVGRRHHVEHPRPDLPAQAGQRASRSRGTPMFPPDTFVPPHIHPTQDEYVYVLDGELTLFDGEADQVARSRGPGAPADGASRTGCSTARARRLSAGSGSRRRPSSMTCSRRSTRWPTRTPTTSSRSPRSTRWSSCRRPLTAGSGSSSKHLPAGPKQSRLRGKGRSQDLCACRCATGGLRPPF